MKLLKCKWLSWLVSYRNLKQCFHLASLFSVTNKTTNLLWLPWFLEDISSSLIQPLLIFQPSPDTFLTFPPSHPAVKPHCFLLYVYPLHPMLFFSSAFTLAVPSSWLLFQLSTVKVSLYVWVTSGSDGKESACNAGDPGLIPVLGRSPGEGNSNPLQYSSLQNGKEYEKNIYIYICITESLCCTEKLTRYCKSILQ